MGKISEVGWGILFVGYPDVKITGKGGRGKITEKGEGGGESWLKGGGGYHGQMGPI